jgi:coenzyme F420-0:L-glutamate ligase / coenzyme F420-1:gamma-L-glutamate ligase
VITATPIENLGEIERGADLGALIAQAEVPMEDGDVLVIAHKIVSKAEGSVRSLRDVHPGERALALAAQQGRDPRHIQVVLDQSRSIVRAAAGVLICETRHGFICANAGVDSSNVPGADVVVVLPDDPDASARALRARIRELTGVVTAVVITDSFGRAWRIGQCDVAIGCAGLRPVEDWRGHVDANARPLSATVIAVADELAAAADLARRKDGNQPVVLVRGARHLVCEEDGPGAASIIRAAEYDLFR